MARDVFGSNSREIKISGQTRETLDKNVFMGAKTPLASRGTGPGSRFPALRAEVEQFEKGFRYR
jgi:hypothetical protein